MLKSMDPAAFLDSPESLTVLAGAGAGKTSLARMVAINGLRTGRQICYFPCFTYNDTHESLEEAIIQFLLGMSPGVCREDACNYLNSCELLLLDGCDEAKKFGSSLADEIVELAWKTSSGPLYINGVVAPCAIPTLLRNKVTFDKKANQLIIEEYLLARERKLLCDEIKSLNPISANIVEAALTASVRRVIAFSRPSHVFDLSRISDRLTLRRFTDVQLNEFFTKWFSHEKTDWCELWAFLLANDHIRQVCRTPLVATIVASLFEKNRELPRSRTEVYTHRFDMLLSSWDAARNVRRASQVTATGNGNRKGNHFGSRKGAGSAIEKGTTCLTRY